MTIAIPNTPAKRSIRAYAAMRERFGDEWFTEKEYWDLLDEFTTCPGDVDFDLGRFGLVESKDVTGPTIPVVLTPAELAERLTNYFIDWSEMPMGEYEFDPDNNVFICYFRDFGTLHMYRAA